MVSGEFGATEAAGHARGWIVQVRELGGLERH